MDDRRLLDEYATNGVESAFEELIRRHLDFVYSTAMRQLGDPPTSYCTQPAPASLAGIITKAALETTVAGAFSSLVGITLKSTIMTKSSAAITSVIILAFGIPSIVLWRQNERLRREAAQLIEKSEKLEQGRLAALASVQGSAEELARLRAQQTELLRLRDEVAQSRRLTGANKNKANPGEARVENNPEASNPVPKTFEASFDARIPSGQTLVVGGWQTQPGKRAMALVVPTSIDAAGNVLASTNAAAQVHIETTIIEVPDSLWNTLGLEPLQAGSQALNQKTVLTKEKTREMLTQLTQSDGVTILSSPRVTTLDGLKATISSGDVDSGSGQSLTYDPHFVTGENAYDISIGLQMTNISARVP